MPFDELAPVRDNTPMTQCTLEQRRGSATAARVVYIPTVFAIEGSHIRIREPEDKKWLPGEWQVVAVWGRLNSKTLVDLRSDHKAFRYYEAKNKKHKHKGKQ